ncbi:MAG: ABC transporter ATP-binding protein [Firmicutes bacterium]|nr:ABC transporter ATP-binding protein [Bacillota bacterium]
MLQIKGVSKNFGGLKAVNNCSLAVKKGSITGLIGPNGAGKSTLFNLITGFIPLDRGEVTFNGENITGISPHILAGKGLVRTFQTPNGFPNMTVMENMLVVPHGQQGERLLDAICFPCRVKEEEKRNAAKALQLLEIVNLVGKRNELVKNLSAAECRLLEMVRQLMLGPSMLCLDEPASGVNPAMQRKLLGLINDLRKQGHTFLIIEHNLSFIMALCDIIYVMETGAIITRGTPDEVASDPKVIEIYIGGVA